MIIVDTGVWIEILQGSDSRKHHVLPRLIEKEEDISTTEIILKETLQGINEDEDFKRKKDYLLVFPLHRLKGIETYLKAIEIFRECRKKVRPSVKPLILLQDLPGISRQHPGTSYVSVFSGRGE
jgi:hypothetical protein